MFDSLSSACTRCDVKRECKKLSGVVESKKTVGTSWYGPLLKMFSQETLDLILLATGCTVLATKISVDICKSKVRLLSVKEVTSDNICYSYMYPRKGLEKISDTATFVEDLVYVTSIFNQKNGVCSI